MTRRVQAQAFTWRLSDGRIGLFLDALEPEEVTRRYVQYCELWPHTRPELTTVTVELKGDEQ